MSQITDADASDPRFIACVDMIGQSGGKTFQVRYDEEQDPVVWVAVAELRGGRWECAGGKSPLQASYRLLQVLYNGGWCGHCGKASGVTLDWQSDMPQADSLCWWVYDPETQKFRRSCEGETKGRALGMTRDGQMVKRNDPCPCGSGKKWKRCHGT